jgi:hypothetical protein
MNYGNTLLNNIHMMRFTAFPEIQLNPGIRDIGDCRRAKNVPIAPP